MERFANYEPVVARVRSTSTIELRSDAYSVPSRLIGQPLSVHLRHDRLDLFLRSPFVETLPRFRRRADVIGPLRRIDCRHVIDSLRRNPRALLRAQLQDDIFSPARVGGSYGESFLLPCHRMRPPMPWSTPSMSLPAAITFRVWSAIWPSAPH